MPLEKYGAASTEGYERAIEGGWGAVLLDWMLPGMDGLTLLGRLRDRRDAVPVLMLTARVAALLRRERLHRALWGETEAGSNTVDVHMAALRKKLDSGWVFRQVNKSLCIPPLPASARGEGGVSTQPLRP